MSSRSMASRTCVCDPGSFASYQASTSEGDVVGGPGKSRYAFERRRASLTMGDPSAGIETPQAERSLQAP